MNRLILALAIGCGPVQAGPPNVILIVADDLGQRDLGCYGSTFYRTPHIDRLARDGARFSDFYAACPVCSPTRASILTGKYPTRVGITDWLPGRPDRPDQKLCRPPLRQQLALEELTIAEALQPLGYATGHVGKWHLGGDGFGPTAQGFDVNIAGDHTGTPRNYFAPFRNNLGSMPGLEKAPAGEYLTDRLAAEAVKFITSNRDRPFFLYMPHYAPHTPLKAKPEVVAKYPDARKAGVQSHPVYAAMVEGVDDAVGTVLKALDDMKLADSTIVLFTSDNGGLVTAEGGPTGATSNAPLRKGKGFLYEGGVRVPLIVRWPSVTKQGGVIEQPACSIDFFATLVAACGNTTGGTDGVNLRPALEGRRLPERELYWHYPHYANQGSQPGGAVRAGDWKLIEHYEDNRRELYKVREDISETRDLAAEQPRRVEELAAKLAAWRTATGAKMPTPNPNYKPAGGAKK